MKILIAVDDEGSRHVIETALVEWGHSVLGTAGGSQALEELQRGDCDAQLAIVDWMMTGLNGGEICSRIREDAGLRSMYLIVLTAQAANSDVAAALEAGADDYITRPFDDHQLRARVNVGVRVSMLQRELAIHIKGLEDAMSRVKQLQRLLPICCYCKRIRDDGNYWQAVDSYLSVHSGVEFSHSICPACLDNELAKLKGQ